MRRSLLAVLAAACVLAGCGSTTHNQCTQTSAAMGCVLTHVPGPTSSVLLQVTRSTAFGVDFGWGGPSVATFRAHGWRLAASYLSDDPSKNWHSAEVHELHDAGISTVDVWETSATLALDGYGACRSAAIAANREADALGEHGVPIYLALDFDETTGQAPAVESCFRGWDSELGVARSGAYGSYYAIGRLFLARLIRYGWQTYAWSGGLWDRRAQLEQYLNGSSVDYDRAIATDFGEWPRPVVVKPKPTPRPKPAPKPIPKPAPTKPPHTRRYVVLTGLITRHHCTTRPTPPRYRHACTVWRAQLKETK